MPTTDQQPELTRSLHRSHGSFELALAPVLMALIGLWLDKTFQTLPVFTIVLAVVVLLQPADSVAVVGFLGAWAIVQGVYMAIASIALRFPTSVKD